MSDSAMAPRPSPSPSPSPSPTPSSSSSTTLTPTSTTDGSVGRTSGKRTMRQATSDVLSAHPLLASPPGEILSSSGPYAVYSRTKQHPTPARTSSLTPLNASANGQDSTPDSPTTTPSSTPAPPLISRASNSTLPYGRPSTGSAISSSPSSSSVGRAYARSISEAQEKLQGQQLKADVQGLGLSNESAGSMIVNRLVQAFANGEHAEWSGVLAALMSHEKAVLLLPAENMPPGVGLIPAFLMDHIALVDASAPTASSSRKGFVTLSGLRGFFDANEIVFASYAKPSPNQDLSDPDVLRSILSTTYGGVTGATYPSILLVSSVSKLAIPRPSSSRTASPAPGSGRSAPGSSTSSRLAALFAKPLSDDLPPIVPAPPGLLSGASTSTSSEPSTSGAPTPTRHSLEISVLAIGKIVRASELLKGISRSTAEEVRRGLESIEGCNDAALVDRVVTFVHRVVPSVWGPGGVAAAMSPPIDDVSDAYQDLSDATRIDLGRAIKGIMVGSKGGDTESFGAKDYAALETRVDAALEKVEELITTVLYDRLFAPTHSNDAQEDEGLTSRVRALNALDLSLDHLGVDVEAGEASEEWDKESRTMRECLEGVIGLVGKEVDRLRDPAIRSPRAKLSIFVALHKLIVDQLSELPSVPLKRDVASGSVPVQDRLADVEMDDASLRTNGSDSRSLSPTKELDEDDTLLQTPKAQKPGTETNATPPEMSLPDSELATSVHEATSSSLFDPSPSSKVITTGVASSSKSTMRGKAPSSSSADLILPLLIYATVRHNPPLPSHLKYAQRFRAESLMRGEASYCATNVQAVIEFLNHVDLSSLGLNSSKLAETGPGASSGSSIFSSLGGRGSRPSSVSSNRRIGSSSGQAGGGTRELDQFVDQANRSLVSVVGMLFGPGGFAPKTIEDVKNVLDGAGTAVARKATGGILRRQNTAQSTVTTASTGETDREKRVSTTKEREMVDFVPGSGEEAAEEGNEYAEPEPTIEPDAAASDTRSIRSISSILRRESAVTGSATAVGEDRPSLGERIASIPGLGRFTAEGKAAAAAANKDGVGPTQGKAASFFSAIAPNSPTRSRRSTVSSLTEPPLASPAPSSFSFFAPATSGAGATQPLQKFMECDVDDLKVGDVAELLREYKKLAVSYVAIQEASGATAQSEARKDEMRT